MDRLPAEIREIIFSHIPRFEYPGWPLVATVSRAWQDTVERHTFKRIGLKSTCSVSMAILSSAAMTRRRAAYIKSILYTIEIPAHVKNPSEKATDDDTGDYVNVVDMLEDNRVFTRAISRLFHILARWPTDAAAINLTIQAAYSAHESRETVRLPEFAYLDLERPFQLPLLPCVGCLEMIPCESLRLFDVLAPLHTSLETQIQLSKLCTNLFDIRWRFDQPRIWLPLLKQMRTEAIEAMMPAGHNSRLPLFPDGAVLRLRTTNYMWTHNQRLPNLNYPLTYDPFCAAMRNISLNLRRFDYSGTLDPALFWRADDEDAETTPLPHWDFLERMEIHTSLTTSSGQRLYRGDKNHPSDEPLPHDAPSHWPPGYGYPSENAQALAYMENTLEKPLYLDEENHLEYSLRPAPNALALEPLLMAFARAIGAMPKLKLAEVIIWYGSLYRIHIAYTLKYKGYLDEPLPGCAKPPGYHWPRLFVQFQGNRRLDQRIVDLFMESVRRVQGRELLVIYVSDMGTIEGIVDK